MSKIDKGCTHSHMPQLVIKLLDLGYAPPNQQQNIAANTFCDQLHSHRHQQLLGMAMTSERFL